MDKSEGREQERRNPTAYMINMMRTILQYKGMLISPDYVEACDARRKSVENNIRSDVFINKYNIRDKELLEKFEIQKVFAKLLSLDVKPARIAYTYDTEHPINVHKYLFGDIYEWAGVF